MRSARHAGSGRARRARVLRGHHRVQTCSPESMPHPGLRTRHRLDAPPHSKPHRGRARTTRRRHPGGCAQRDNQRLRNIGERVKRMLSVITDFSLMSTGLHPGRIRCERTTSRWQLAHSRALDRMKSRASSAREKDRQSRRQTVILCRIDNRFKPNTQRGTPCH